MRNVCKHVAALAVTALQRGGHLVETVRETAQILRTFGWDAGLQVTIGNCLSCKDHIRQRVDEAPHQQNRYDSQKQRQNQRDEPNRKKNCTCESKSHSETISRDHQISDRSMVCF